VIPARWWSAAAFLAPFALFCFTLPPDVAYWDTAEMQTVPYIFGISHPTGFPTFVVAGWFFSHLYPLGTVAYRLSLMSAAAMAGAAWSVYAAAVEIETPPPVAAAASLLFAVGGIVWSRGTRAEVHAFALLFSGLVLWQAIRFYRDGSADAFCKTALAYGAALATHGIATLLAPGLAMLLAPRVRGITWRTFLAACGLFVAPLLLYLYIPLRSAQLFAAKVDPTLALGLPPGRPFWDFAHPATLPEFLRYMAGGEGSQVGNGFAKMFSAENYPDVFARFGTTTLHEFGPFMLFFAALGIVLQLKRDPWLTVALFVACAVCVPYGLLYPEADQDRYLMTAFWGIAVFAAYGTARGFRFYVDKGSEALPTAAAAVIVAGAAFALLWLNRDMFGQREDPGARQFIQRVVANTPDNAIIVANWTYATSLGYAAFVDHTFGNRIVVTAFPPDYASFYPQWLQTRRIYMVNQPQFEDPLLKEIIIATDPAIVEVRRR
jgi:hypothetical protein